MEYLLFPKRSYYITQGFGIGCLSHSKSHAIDVSAAKSGDYKIYMPFSGYIAKVYVDGKTANAIWLVSNDRVMCADGKARYAVVMMAHPNEIPKIKVGKTFKQNDYFLTDGTSGGVARHLHFELAVYDNKSDINIGWYNTKDSYGSYALNNNVDPTKYMCFTDNIKTYNNVFLNKKYTFKNIKDVKAKDSEYTVGIYQTLANVRVRTGAGTNYRQKLVKELTADGKKHATSKNLNDQAFYKKGTQFSALQIINKNNEVWAASPSGWINIKIGDTICCKKI